ncbi:nucleotide sugar dehydrogenase [Salinirubrum litoreum]|uniref:UDP-N-acetyl-D-mannosamine dehydrogenase n=1 Tax=Salinirubrum litoreum TaxID=1126234 RepID=A0ABD5RE12_9EURY
MRLCVVGLGHVGLPLALLFAREHTVVGVDVDEQLVAALNRGELSAEEPAIRALFERVRADFTARTAPVPADAYLLATPTPLDPEANAADLSAVIAATESVGEVLSPGDLAVLVSTVPPGTTDELVAPLLARTADTDDFLLAHCPERALPGNTLAEMTANSRLVGGVDAASTAAASDLFGAVAEGPIHETTARLAEFVKLTENTYRDVNIALANELATVAERVGVDGHRAIDLANEHPRVAVHRPGPGVGGHCITIDPLFLAQSAPSTRLISTARAVNDGMAHHAAGLVRETLRDAFAASMPVDRRPTVTLLGVAYKGDVSDTRETPALPITRLLQSAGYEVRVYDPHVESFAVDPVALAEAVTDSDCLLLVTDHAAFHDLDPTEVGEAMATRTLVDTRNHLDADRWREAGFSVRVLGDGRDSPGHGRES